MIFISLEGKPSVFWWQRSKKSGRVRVNIWCHLWENPKSLKIKFSHSYFHSFSPLPKYLVLPMSPSKGVRATNIYFPGSLICINLKNYKENKNKIITYSHKQWWFRTWKFIMTSPELAHVIHKLIPELAGLCSNHESRSITCGETASCRRCFLLSPPVQIQF